MFGIRGRVESVVYRTQQEKECVSEFASFSGAA